LQPGPAGPATSPKGNRERTDTEPGYTIGCDCCQERLKQLAAAINEANAQILAVLEAIRQDLGELISTS
jgi:hypothetical protein